MPASPHHGRLCGFAQEGFMTTDSLRSNRKKKQDAASTPVASGLQAQAISQSVLLEKYAKGDERSIDDVRRRVAHALAQVEAPAARGR